MNNFLTEEIDRIVKNVPDNEISHELASIIYSLGRDAENIEEYDYAFSTLLGLYDRNNKDVQVRVIQAFSLMAVLKQDIKILDRSIVEPMILESWATAVNNNRQIIEEAVDDINHCLKWNMTLTNK